MAILTLILPLISGRAQSIIDSLPYTLDTSLTAIEVDKLQNTWYFYPNYILRKSNDVAYNDTLFLPIQKEKIQFDLSFSFKNLVFNPSRNTIELLNSRWGSLSKIHLDKLNILQPSLANFSADENYWVLDRESNQLFKINESGIIKSQIQNPFISKKNYFPTYLTDNGSEIIALDTSFGLFILTSYGQLKQAIPIESIYSFYKIENKIYIQTPQKLSEYSLESPESMLKKTGMSLDLGFKLKSIAIQKKNAIIFFENNRIYKIDKFQSLFRRK